MGSAYFKTCPWSLLTHWTPRRNTSRVRNHHQIHLEPDCLYYLNTLLLQKTLWKGHISSFYCYYTQRICLHRRAAHARAVWSCSPAPAVPSTFPQQGIRAAPALLKVAVKKQRELGLTPLATHKMQQGNHSWLARSPHHLFSKTTWTSWHRDPCWRIGACVQQFTIPSKAELTLPPSETATVLLAWFLLGFGWFFFGFGFGNPLPILHGWYHSAGGQLQRLLCSGQVCWHRVEHLVGRRWQGQADVGRKSWCPQSEQVSGLSAAALGCVAGLEPPQAAGWGGWGAADPLMAPRKAQPKAGACRAPLLTPPSLWQCWSSLNTMQNPGQNPKPLCLSNPVWQWCSTLLPSVIPPSYLGLSPYYLDILAPIIITDPVLQGQFFFSWLVSRILLLHQSCAHFCVFLTDVYWGNYSMGMQRGSHPRWD